MLFDLQSPRRKRVVQVLFGGMALLLGLSLVLFGIGSGLQGNPLEEVLGTGGNSAEEAQQNEIDDAQEKVDANPRDLNALSDLIAARYAASNQQYELDEETGQTTITPDAEAELERAADSWDAYVKAAGAKVDPGTAVTAVQVFGALGQAQLQRGLSGSGEAALDSVEESRTNFKNAAEAQQFAADAKDATPEAKLQVAEYFYFANDIPAAEAAVQAGLAAAPANQRASLQKQADAAKSQAKQIADAFDQYRKQLAKASAQGGATGGSDPNQEALGELGAGGALGGGGGLGGGGLTVP